MSRRCTLTVSSFLVCLAVTTGCGSLPSGTDRANEPTATPMEALTELRASYQDLAARLDASLCRFKAVAGSSSASVQALRLAATDMANSSNSFTNHLAVLPWPGTLQADSQILIRAIAAVESELRIAMSRTTKTAVRKHIQAAGQLIARIPPAASPLGTHLHVAAKSGCD